MKKAAFYGENPKSIFSVYNHETIARLRSMVDLPDRVIGKQDLGKEDFSQVEFLFSTWGCGSLSEEEWAAYFPNLKVLFYGAGATDNFARPLFVRGVHVVSAWKANAVPVAEYTVSAIILGLKNFYQLIRTGRSRQNWSERSKGRGAFGATVTLLGSTGAVATRVAEMLKNYRLNVIGIPSPVAERTISFAEAFAVSDVVSNHLPDRDDNVGCIDGALLESMPQGGFFLNTGRGRQVNEPEMIEVLKRRPVQPDVTEINRLVVYISLEEQAHIITGIRFVIFGFFRSDERDVRVLPLDNFRNPWGHDADQFAFMFLLKTFNVAEPADGISDGADRQLNHDFFARRIIIMGENRFPAAFFMNDQPEPDEEFFDAGDIRPRHRVRGIQNNSGVNIGKSHMIFFVVAGKQNTDSVVEVKTDAVHRFLRGNIGDFSVNAGLFFPPVPARRTRKLRRKPEQTALLRCPLSEKRHY